MRREDGRISLSRRALISYVLLGSVVLGSLAVCTAALLTAIIDEPPPFLLVAFVLLIALRIGVGLGERMRFLVRRRARLRRMRNAGVSGPAE